MRIQLNPSQNFNTFHESQKENETDKPINMRTIAAEPIKEIHKKYKNTSAVTIAALGTVVLLFSLSRGFQKNVSRFLDKTKDYLETRVARTSINDSKKQKSFYEFFIRRINSFMHKLESINNITSLKDILFMKLMYETKPTKKMHEAITQYFAKVSEQTVLKSYEKTEKMFNKMNQIFDELDEYILKNAGNEIVEFEGKQYTKRELVEEAKSQRELARLTLNAFIQENTIKIRFKEIKDSTSSLYSKFWDASFKDFWSKNNKFKRKEMWQNFIAAEQVKGAKTYIGNTIASMRNAITYIKKDEAVNINDFVKTIDRIIPENDTEGIEIIKRLKWFSKNPEIYEKNKDLFFNELERLKAHHFPLSSDNKAAAELEEYKNENIKYIYKQVNDNKTGMLQDILDIYYKIAPFEVEKFGALISLKKAVKSLNKSVYLESIEYFDKVRDLRLGSAPTDILTIVLSFITLSLGLGHAKDKDARISITLRSGIPVVGGIATAMYSAAKLVSGGKSILLGLLSGIILNQLGYIADNMRKSIKENRTEKTAV